MAMRFEVSGQSGAVNFITAYAPTEVSKDENKQAFWDRLCSVDLKPGSVGPEL